MSNLHTFSFPIWREVVDQTRESLKGNIAEVDIISPFGFELIYSTNIAPSKLRKFYFYIKLSHENNTIENRSFILKNTLSNIRESYPSVYDDFVACIVGDKVNLLKAPSYICKEDDKIIDLQFRETDKGLLQEYADYVILSHQLILENKGEVEGYKNKLMARGRVFQFFIMQECVYGEYLPVLPIDVIKQAKKYTYNRIMFLYNTANQNKEMTKEEEHLINNYVIPRSIMIRELIKDNPQKEGNLIDIDLPTYHLTAILSEKIPMELYKKVTNTVINSYNKFWNTY